MPTFITDIEIDITYDQVQAKYVATVDKVKASSKRAGFVRWEVKRKDDFPSNATVIIQFVDSPTPPKANTDGPFVDGGVMGGRYTTTGKYITDLVGFTADGGYNYTISYDDNGTEQLLLDPEIVVDGNAPILNKLLKGLQAGLKLMRAAASVVPKQGAAKTRAAKKAKAAKAKSSPKRKAKKR